MKLKWIPVLAGAALLAACATTEPVSPVAAAPLLPPAAQKSDAAFADLSGYDARKLVYARALVENGIGDVQAQIDKANEQMRQEVAKETNTTRRAIKQDILKDGFITKQDVEVLKNVLVKEYADYFTTDELIELEGFQKSPLGRRMSGFNQQLEQKKQAIVMQFAAYKFRQMAEKLMKSK